MRSSVGTVPEVRARVVERLRERKLELVEALFARVRDGELDRSGDEDAEYLAGLRAAVVAAVEYVLEGVQQGEGWVAPVPVQALAQARRAARVGVSLDTVLRRYVAGSALLGEFIMEEAERTNLSGARSALTAVLRSQASVLDRLLAAITVEYEDELRRAGRSPELRRLDQVKRLLDGEAVEEVELDYELGGWHLGVIAVGEDAAQALRGSAERVGSRLLSVAGGERCVWAWLGGRDSFALGDVQRILADSEQGADRTGPQGIGPHPPDRVVFALGEPARGPEGWRLTHRQAQAALQVALRRRESRGAREGVTVTRYADVALLATALADPALGRVLIEVYLAPLDESAERGSVLRATLRAYLAAERSVSSAAIALQIARSTVESRMRTIEARLGRTLHPCPPELEIALCLEELGEPTDGIRPFSA